MLLLAHLLARPNSGLIHALQLAAWADPSPIAGAVLELPGPDGPTPALVTTSATFSQCSLQREEMENLRHLRRKMYELQSIIDAPGEPDVVKTEAEEELAALRQAQHDLLRVKEDAPHRSVRAVRRALWRAIKAMATAIDHRGKPIPVLRDLAQHLDLYLVAPSSRYHGLRGRAARAELAGCFQYTPPKDVRWIIH
jgi:hypothetical protein